MSKAASDALTLQSNNVPVLLTIQSLVNVAGSASTTLKMILACALQGFKQVAGSCMMLQAAAPMI